MIERGRRPATGGVAKRTVRGKTGIHMIGAGGAGKVRLMAGVTGGRRVDVAIVHMTLRATHGRMCSSERIVGVKRVVELGVEPVFGGVTGSAVVRKSELHMGRIVAVGKVGHVAGVAIGWGSGENIIDVT